MKDGTAIDLKDMSYTHLVNTINMMERKAFGDGVLVRVGGGSLPEDVYYEEYRLVGESALAEMNYQKYVAEKNRRNVKDTW